MSTQAETKVEVVITTFARPALLARALASLQGQGPRLAGIVVVNNGRDAESAAVTRSASPVPARIITPVANLGTGGGIAAGLELATGTAGITHVLVMDDDACATAGALDAMIDVQQATGAGAVAPLVIDSRGIITWVPGPLPQPAWDVIRSGLTPGQFRERCGQHPLPWNWAPWPALLLEAGTVRRIGFPRADLWYQATDIEYTLRLTASAPGMLAPTAVCRHLPPPETDERRRLKSCWALQNNAYVSVHFRHGWRALRHLPGNHLRHWWQHGGSGALVESLRAFWLGAVLGRPVPLEEYPAAQKRND